MKMSYDRQRDVAYLSLCDEASALDVERRISLDPWIMDGPVTLDLDQRGRLVGLEVCEASLLLRPEVLQRTE